MFLHTENHQLLWQTIQRSPYLIEFAQKYTGHREVWFRGILEQFYTQWISDNGSVPTNARELLEMNKYALQTMVADLKQTLGYSGSITERVWSEAGGQQNVGIRDRYAETQSENVMRSYNVADEKKRREDKQSSDFNQFQSEYNKLLKSPDLPMRELPSESVNEKITNMEELIQEHKRMREMELEKYLGPSTAKVLQNPNMPPKLKIMDEIERIEMEIGTIPERGSSHVGSRESSHVGSRESSHVGSRESLSKSVHWSSDNTIHNPTLDYEYPHVSSSISI